MDVVKFSSLAIGKLSDISDAQLAKYQAENPKLNVTKERIKVFRASTEAVDRDKDVILQDGWDLSNYQKNPVFLMHHQQRSVPVGRTVEAQITTYEGIKGLYLFVFFPTADISEDSDTAFKAVDSGLMTAVSVGYRTKEYTWIDSPAKAAQYNMPIGGILFKSVELTECSLVAIPANQEAGLVKSITERLEKAFGDVTIVKTEGAKETEGELVQGTMTEEAPVDPLLIENEDLGKETPKEADPLSGYAKMAADLGLKVSKKTYIDILLGK